MDVKKVNLYLAKYGNHFSSFKHAALREALMQVPDEYFDEIISTSLLNPTYMQVASVLGGISGIDRFLLGDKKMGFVKLFLLGGCGIVAIIDMFKVQGRTKSKNYKKIMQCIAAVVSAYQAPVAPMPGAPMYAQQPYAPAAPIAAPIAAPVGAPVAPAAPVAPKAPVMAQAPAAPAAPAYVVPSAPKAPVAPVAPVAPAAPVAPVAPKAPVVTAPAAKPAEEKAVPVVEAPKAEEKKVEEVKIPDIAPTPYKK